MSDKKERCIASIYSGFSSYRCGKKATITEGGKRWCSVHAPSKVKARREKSETKWAEQRKRDEAADAADAEMRRKAEAYPAMLDLIERAAAIIDGRVMSGRDDWLADAEKFTDADAKDER